MSPVQDLPIETLRYIQAPMVGISDLPFRLLCSKWGATLTYTAMFHTTPLIENRDFRERLVRDLEFGRQVGGGTPPVVAQLAGNDAQRLVEGGKVVAGLVDALELNLGCPQQRAKEGRYGAYLLHKKDVSLVCSLVSALSTLPLPVHTKFRLPPTLTPADYAAHLAASGSRTITLHARPAGSPSRRRDLWGLRVDGIGEVRRGLDEVGFQEVRVVGNGGVQVLEDVGRLTREQAVEGWMVGEELAGNFRFFHPSHPSPRALDLATEYLDLVELYPSIVPLQTVQRHLRNFVESDLLSAHTKERKSFLKELEATADVAAVRRLCEGEAIVEAWGARSVEDP